ncbi:MAG: chain-length determining protein, partial [Bauldia sp.]|nr:chain-length determining protein [Bauldia sp.]
DNPELRVEEFVLAAFYEKLSVYQVERSRVITVEFSSTDPNLAATAANSVAEEYITLQSQVKRGTDEGATTFLESEIASLSARVRDAEAAVERFRADADLFGRGGDNGTLIEQQLVQLNGELARVRAEGADAAAKAAQIRARLASGSALTSTEVLSSELIQRLSEQEIALRAQIAELSATLLPAHPRIRELNAQLGNLTTQIRLESEKILASLEGQTELAAAREREINQNLDQLKAATAQANEAEVELRALEREAAAQRELLQTYLLRYREADARVSGGYVPPDARIISRASAPISPSFPKKVPMTIAIVVATLILAFAIALIRALMKRPRPGVSFAGPIPLVPGAVPVEARVRRPDENGQHRPMPHEPAMGSALAEEGVERSLGAIAARIVASGKKRVWVAMAEPDNDDRPLAAVALARALARQGTRTLLVDLAGDDADRVAMGEDPTQPGFGDLFAGTTSFAQVIFRDSASPAHFIPMGNAPLAPENYAEPRFATLVDALEYAYDLLVFDADPTSLAGLAARSGIVVLVTEKAAADPRTVKAYERVRTQTGAEELMLLAVDPPHDERLAGEAA